MPLERKPESQVGECWIVWWFSANQWHSKKCVSLMRAKAWKGECSKREYPTRITRATSEDKG